MLVREPLINSSMMSLRWELTAIALINTRVQDGDINTFICQATCEILMYFDSNVFVCMWFSCCQCIIKQHFELLQVMRVILMSR